MSRRPLSASLLAPRAAYLGDGSAARTRAHRRADNLRAIIDGRHSGLTMPDGSPRPARMIADVANDCGIERAASLYDLLNGSRPISLRMIDRLAPALGLEPAELLGLLDATQTPLAAREALS